MSSSATPSTQTAEPFSFGPTLSPSPHSLPNHGPAISQAALVGIIVAAIIVTSCALMCFRWLRLSPQARTLRAFVTCSPTLGRRQDSSSAWRRTQSRDSAWDQEAGQPHMAHPNLHITPALLYQSGLGPIPTAYDPSNPAQRRDRRTRAPDVDAQGRRLDSRNEDADGDDKDELPAYVRQNPGLPTYVELRTDLPPLATHPST